MECIAVAKAVGLSAATLNLQSWHIEPVNSSFEANVLTAWRRTISAVLAHCSSERNPQIITWSNKLNRVLSYELKNSLSSSIHQNRGWTPIWDPCQVPSHSFFDGFQCNEPYWGDSCTRLFSFAESYMPTKSHKLQWANMELMMEVEFLVADTWLKKTRTDEH